METPKRPRKPRRNTVDESERIVSSSVSLPPELMAIARKKAKEEGRSFSNYVASLIARDTKE
jgi:hypothetical protein